MVKTGLMTAAFLGLFIMASGCGSPSKGSGPEPTPQQGSDQATASFSPEAVSMQKVFATTWAWDTPTKAETPVSATLTFLTPTGNTLQSVTDVEVSPWMPSMGHGTYTDDQEITPLPGRPGAFRVSGLYFIMGGPWEIRITATVNGIQDRLAIKATVQ